MKNSAIFTFRRASRARMFATCALPVIVLCGTSPAYCQTADPQPTQNAQENALDDIVVTARRQTESLQDVPVAVTAIGGKELGAYELDKAQEFATRIPTLNITVGGSGGGAAISLRGIGSSQISAAFDSAVALNIDGVMSNSARLVQGSFFDLQQIEVLKGPQSLYFGKSASAGVMSFKSRDPGDQFELNLGASYEFEEKGHLLEGVVSGPVTDTFGARLAVRYYKNNEIMFNNFPGAKHPEVGESGIDSRLTLKWQPSSKLTANLKAAYSNYKNDIAQTFYDIRCVGATPVPSVYSPLIGLLAPPLASLGINQQTYECGDKNQIYTHAQQSPIEAVQMPRNNGGTPYSDLNTYFARLALDYNLSSSLTLSSITGYIKIHSEEGTSFSRTTEGGGWATPINERETFEQELRLASDFAGPLNFQLGAYYENGKIHFQTGQTAFGATYALAKLHPLLAGASPLIASFGPTGADRVTGNTYDWEYIQNTNTETVSLFGSAKFDISDRLTASGGLRWTDENKSGQFTVPYTHGFLQTIGFTVPNGTKSPVLKFKDDNISWEGSLTYKLNDDANVYAAYKTGFKSGGIDNSALPTATTFAAINACAPAFKPGACEVIFGSETAKGFEVGLKSELFERSLRLNLVGYRYIFNNLQTQQFIATQTLFRTFNIGEITTWGLEGDLLWRPGIRGVTVTGAIAYLNSEFTQDFISATGFNFRGLAPAGAPKWSGNVGIDYQGSISDGLKIGLGGNLSFVSSRYSNDDLAVRPLEDPYQSLDLRASIGPKNDRWMLSVVGTNVTDNIWVTASTARPFAVAGQPADLSIRENRGRQVFLKLQYRY